MILQCHEQGDNKGTKTLTAISELHKIVNSTKTLQQGEMSMLVGRRISFNRHAVISQ